MQGAPAIAFAIPIGWDYNRMMGKRFNLTGKQEKFAQAVAKGKSDAEAYREAGYKVDALKPESLWRLAHAVRHNIKVSSRINQLKEKGVKKAELSVERHVREMAAIAYFDMRKLFGPDGELLQPPDWPDEVAAAVSGFEAITAPDGKTKITKLKLWSKDKQIELGGRYLEMWKNQVELTMGDELVNRILAGRKRAGG